MQDKTGTELLDVRKKPSPKCILDLLLLAQALKTTKRTGWVRHEVSQPESIADHMYRMGIMSLIACPGEVDRERCIKMSLVHDLAEAIVGDIPPVAGISKEEKADALKQIKAMLGDNTAVASEIEELFHEYEAGETAEAVLVKDFDKLEMILQASEYEEAQQMDLEPFFGSTAGSFRTETGCAVSCAPSPTRALRGRAAARHASLLRSAPQARAGGGDPRPEGGPEGGEPQVGTCAPRGGGDGGGGEMPVALPAFRTDRATYFWGGGVLREGLGRVFCLPFPPFGSPPLCCTRGSL